MVRGNAYEPVEDADGRPFSIDEFVEVFLKEFGAILVFDIDGIEGSGAQFDAITSLDRAAPEVWWDGGARDDVDVVNVLTAGADRALVSTRSFAGFRELARAVELSESLVFEIVLRGGLVMASSREFKGRGAADLAKGARAAGVEDFVLIDAARPLGSPVEWSPAAEIAPHAKGLFVGGGLDLEGGRSLTAPLGIPLKGAVVDLISVLSPYL
jgi:phosphoribosylformimino-5-aminoimidazole carboxamide ribonucleotide (ProFAR) isomerase